MPTRCAPMSYAMSPRTSPECHRHKNLLVCWCTDVTAMSPVLLSAQEEPEAGSVLTSRRPRRRRSCPATRAGTAPARSKDAKFDADAARLVAASDSPSGDDDRFVTRAPHRPASPRSRCRRGHVRTRTPGLPGDPSDSVHARRCPAGPVHRTAKPAPGFSVSVRGRGLFMSRNPKRRRGG